MKLIDIVLCVFTCARLFCPQPSKTSCQVAAPCVARAERDFARGCTDVGTQGPQRDGVVSQGPSGARHRLPGPLIGAARGDHISQHSSIGAPLSSCCMSVPSFLRPPLGAAKDACLGGSVTWGAISGQCCLLSGVLVWIMAAVKHRMHFSVLKRLTMP